MSCERSICLAWTGASGSVYGLRLLDRLLAASCRVQLVYSPAARLVVAQEMDLELPASPAEAERMLGGRYADLPGRLEVFGHDDWFAPIASGSNAANAMVICPCSMGTLAAVTHGLADNLIERAADVALKEKRPLILVPRETPLSTIHLDNMLRLAHAGAVILPPCPGFYHRPQTPEDLVDFVIARILDQLGIEHDLLPRWGREPSRTEQL